MGKESGPWLTTNVILSSLPDQTIAQLLFHTEWFTSKTDLLNTNYSYSSINRLFYLAISFI